MALIESALLKIDGLYPTLTNDALWTVWAYNETDEAYTEKVLDLHPDQLVSSSMTQTLNDASDSNLSLRSKADYELISSEYQARPLAIVRNLEGYPFWTVIDSLYIDKSIDEDSGQENWSYNVKLLDGLSVMQYRLLINNMYVTVPDMSVDGAELPANYMKFQLGTGTEVLHALIFKSFVVRNVTGTLLNPSSIIRDDNQKFRGVSVNDPIPITGTPYYSEPKKSWVNTECGEITVLEKISDLDYIVPLRCLFEDNLLYYDFYEEPTKVELDNELSNRVLVSYSAGYEHPDSQHVVAMSDAYGQLRTESIDIGPFPYLKQTSLKEDPEEGLTTAEVNTELSKIADTNLSIPMVGKYIDAQLTVNTLQPWKDFIPGDILTATVTDVDGFDSVDLLVRDISEDIEEDAITYTITLEEMEENNATYRR